jgi:hypothetical protein
LKHYLIVLAPILTVALSGLWLVAQKTIDWEVSKRFLGRAKKAIQERIQKAEHDPSCSPEYLRELKDMLLKVEKRSWRSFISLPNWNEVWAQSL